MKIKETDGFPAFHPVSRAANDDFVSPEPGPREGRVTSQAGWDPYEARGMDVREAPDREAGYEGDPLN
jgi:hypothetical protein